MAKTQSVATGTGHKLKFDDGARNVINDHREFEIGLKRTIGPRGKPLSSKDHTTMHHQCTINAPHTLLYTNRAQIARQLRCKFCNFEIRS
jgi:threonine synthase